MKRIIILVLTATVLASVVKGQFNYAMPDYGFGYFLNVHNTFSPDKNAPCVIANSAQDVEGTCTHSLDCKLSGGRSPARGNCSLIHTCCVQQKICAQTSKARVTYFRQPARPRLETPRTCTLTIQKANDNICQMKVDIISMNIASPIVTEIDVGAEKKYSSKCETDSFHVADNLAPNMPAICGKESNSHFYIHLNDGQKQVNLNMNLGVGIKTTSVETTWNMKITQLECPTRETKYSWTTGKKENRNQAGVDFEKLAPPGCLQYHTDYAGIVKSFNYDGMDAMTTGNDYAVCFKRYGECNIAFTEVSVQIGNDMPTPCEENYIFVPEATPVTNPPNKFCYYVPLSEDPKTLTEDHPGPLYIHVFNAETTTGKPIGFLLNYKRSC